MSSASATRSADAPSLLVLDLVGPALRLAQEGRGTFLGLDHDFGRLVVGMAEDLGAVLAERSRQRRLVDHRVGRSFVGLGHGVPQLLLPLLEHLDAPGHRLQVRLHLVDVEAPADDRRTSGGRCPPPSDAGGGNG